MVCTSARGNIEEPLWNSRITNKFENLGGILSVCQIWGERSISYFVQKRLLALFLWRLRHGSEWTRRHDRTFMLRYEACHWFMNVSYRHLMNFKCRRPDDLTKIIFRRTCQCYGIMRMSVIGHSKQGSHQVTKWKR